MMNQTMTSMMGQKTTIRSTTMTTPTQEESIDLEETLVLIIITHQISTIATISGMIHSTTHRLEVT